MGITNVQSLKAWSEIGISPVWNHLLKSQHIS